MRRLLLLLALGPLGAAEALPPLAEIPDPFDLGPRLALIDYLREHVGVEPQPGADLAALQAQYQALRAQRAAAADPLPERLAELARLLWVDHGIAAPDGATLPQLEALLADERAKVAQELARQQAAADAAIAPSGGGALGAEEQVIAAAPLAAPGGGQGFVLADGKGVSLQQLMALRGRPGRSALEPREIAARCAQSVTLIVTDSGTGSGFFVNESGLMLTCAHVLPRPGERLGVKHRSTVGGQVQELFSPASLIAIDAAADLALLQVRTEAVTSSVLLESGHPVAMGDEVVVIGNPGAGGAVLEQTMTQGIVSSPSREIGGVRHIQTSAAINPGNSGGPLFNQRGNVIGLVVAKISDVDAVGFAVAHEEIVAFLRRCVR